MKNTSVCVVDHGLFIPIALRLAREVEKVYYTTVTDRAFPTVQDIFGDGFEGIELIQCPFQVKREVDAFIFPDIGFGGLQKELVEQGFPVWGHRGADELEVMRGLFLGRLLDTDLPIPSHRTIKGISALRDYLRDKEDLYVKVSRYRGDWETLHWRSWDWDSIELDARSVRLGAWGERMTFYVFDPINTTIEDGCDSWCIDGRFPKVCIHAMEAKDKALIATFQKFVDTPKQLRIANEEFGPILGEYGYRGFFSTEVRITPDGQSYFIDPTCRAGSPPAQLQTELIENYAEVLIGGANGRLVEPKPAAKFGVQALVHMAGNNLIGKSLKIPAILGEGLKPSFCSRIGDRLYFPPGPSQEVCWLTAIGDSIGEAIENLKAQAEVLPEGTECDYTDLADLIRKIQEAEAEGMEFTDQPVPDPEVVFEES